MADELENTEAEVSAAAEAGAAEAATAATETAEVETPAEVTPPGEGASVEGEDSGDDAAEEGSEGEEGEAAYKPNLKFKAGVYNKQTRSLEQKEYDIDPRFHSVMKDADSEKLVRELHEKALGLESVKERFNETRQSFNEVTDENRQIKTSISSLRNVYQTAVKTGNLHKLDQFFQTLEIPQDVVMQYALEKVKLAEMAPEHRNAIMGQLEAERRADTFAQQQADLQAQQESAQLQARAMQVDMVLTRPEVAALVQEFDGRHQKPGAFKAALYDEGNLAWTQEKIDLPPEQAVQRLIERYSLNKPNGAFVPPAQSAAGAATQTPPAAVSANGKPIVQRTAKTIPNVQGRGNASALPAKPRSIEDLKKISKERYG